MSVAGKHVLVTGATSGIGQAAAMELARRGANLTLLARSKEKASAVVEAICDDCGVESGIIIADFSDLGQVRRAAGEYLDGGRPLDILLNNAGLINTRRRESADGFEQTFAVNHLAPFLLTGLLLERMLERRGGRIVNVASNAHEFVRGMNFDDLQSERAYKTFRVYGYSKLANILFTRELAHRLAGTGLTANCMHPGAVRTGMGSNNSALLTRVIYTLGRPFFRSPERGAETAVYLCDDAEVADVSGKYFYDCKPLEPKPWAMDDEAARRLWDISERLAGHHYNFSTDE